MPKHSNRDDYMRFREEPSVDQRLSAIERGLADILYTQYEIARYLRLDYISDQRRDRTMARDLSQALDAIRRMTTLADGLIEQNRVLREQVKNVAGPEAQAKIDAIFDEAEAQAKEIADAMAANTPAENPAPTGSGGGATDED